MTEFQTYFTLGYQHILDWQGYDHMIFLLALITPIAVKEWKKILILITAFTVGHSISLALSTLSLVTFNAEFIELLIPITILITSILNVSVHSYLNNINYLITIFFGLIHGMGFSGYLKSLLGLEQNIFTPILSFNLGLEFGQILFTSFFIILVSITTNLLYFKHKSLNFVLSAIAGITSVFLIIERI